MEGVPLMLLNLENKLMESSMELSDFLKSKSTLIHNFFTRISTIELETDYANFTKDAVAAVTEFLDAPKNNFLVSNRTIAPVKRDLAGQVYGVEITDITENLVYTLIFDTSLAHFDTNRYHVSTIYVGKVNDTKSEDAFTRFNFLLAHYITSVTACDRTALIAPETPYSFTLSFSDNLNSLKSGFFKHTMLDTIRFSLDYMGKPYYRFTKEDMLNKHSIEYIFSQPSHAHKNCIENLHTSFKLPLMTNCLSTYKKSYDENTVGLLELIKTFEYFTLLNPSTMANEQLQVTYNTYSNSYYFKIPNDAQLPTFSVEKEILILPQRFSEIRENTRLLQCLEYQLCNGNTAVTSLESDEKLNLLLQPFNYLLNYAKDSFDID